MNDSKRKVEEPPVSASNGVGVGDERLARKRPNEESSSPREIVGGKRASGSGVESALRMRPRSAPPVPPEQRRHGDDAEFRRAALARLRDSTETGTPDKSAILRRLVEQLNEDCYDSSSEGEDEDDPLLSDVPSHLDPERLGFLVCAQETLRYLYRRGLAHDHPIFTHLRSRFIRGLNQMGLD